MEKMQQNHFVEKEIDTCSYICVYKSIQLIAHFTTPYFQIKVTCKSNIHMLYIFVLQLWGIYTSVPTLGNTVNIWEHNILCLYPFSEPVKSKSYSEEIWCEKREFNFAVHSICYHYY